MAALFSILLALLALVCGASSPSRQSLPFTPGISFAYDGQRELGPANAGSFMAVFTYNSRTGLIVGGETIPTSEASGDFGKITEFLAAKTGDWASAAY